MKLKFLGTLIIVFGLADNLYTAEAKIQSETHRKDFKLPSAKILLERLSAFSLNTYYFDSKDFAEKTKIHEELGDKQLKIEEVLRWVYKACMIYKNWHAKNEISGATAMLEHKKIATALLPDRSDDIKKVSGLAYIPLLEEE